MHVVRQVLQDQWFYAKYKAQVKAVMFSRLPQAVHTVRHNIITVGPTYVGNTFVQGAVLAIRSRSCKAALA